MADRSFLSNHARMLMRIAHAPDVRLRDIVARTGVTVSSGAHAHDE